ncbi:hypothetical protein HOL34_04055 [bacterium]|nr:hypothetical protein [bacterium]MBT3903249.1 hypothetical protein [bacterium]MBT4578143.1 hypothetical protein [bacterium]MBT5345573.1 hypothetical protein [bacterium]MBT6131068.1 hypothetical protein [bacterium]
MNVNKFLLATLVAGSVFGIQAVEGSSSADLAPVAKAPVVKAPVALVAKVAVVKAPVVKAPVAKVASKGFVQKIKTAGTSAKKHITSVVGYLPSKAASVWKDSKAQKFYADHSVACRVVLVAVVVGASVLAYKKYYANKKQDKKERDQKYRG